MHRRKTPERCAAICAPRGPRGALRQSTCTACRRNMPAQRPRTAVNGTKRYRAASDTAKGPASAPAGSVVPGAATDIRRTSSRCETGRRPGQSSARPESEAPAARKASDLDHLEVFLACATLGASPVNGNILPARAGRDAFVWQTGFFVINPAADQAHPASIFHSYAASKSPKNRPRAGAASGRENCQENKSHDGTVLPFLCLATVAGLESCAWRAVKTRKSLARGGSSVPRKRREAA